MYSIETSSDLDGRRSTFRGESWDARLVVFSKCRCEADWWICDSAGHTDSHDRRLISARVLSRDSFR